MIAWDSQGDGVPIVFVHGITDNRHTWHRVVPLLQDGFRCVTLDLRGHGESSDADDYSAFAMADDIATVLDEAGIDEPPILVGHSLGGAVVTIYAASRPARAVVNVDQPLRLGDFARALQPMASMLRGPDVHQALQLVFAALGIDKLPPDDRAWAEDLHARARQDVVLGVWGDVLTATPEDLDALVGQLLPHIEAPYLAIHGADPGGDYVTWLQALVPQVTVERFDGDGHYLHLVEPERFASRVRTFLPS